MKSLTQMKNSKLSGKWCSLALAIAAVMAPAALTAGTVSEKAPAPIAPVEEAPFVSGALSFVADTHFVSYGQDVWGGGDDFLWEQVLFHPSLELNFNLGSGFSAIIGTWFDVNGEGPEAEIGQRVQEVDVWAGLAYSVGDWKFTALYQAWMYASDTEQIVDVKIAYTNFLNPYLLLHGRIDEGASGFDTGLVVQVGIAPAVPVGPVTISFPVTANYDTKGFHGGDAGFSYASGGINVNIPVMKHVSVNVGATYYYTNDQVIPGNVDEAFVAGSAGITIAF